MYLYIKDYGMDALIASYKRLNASKIQVVDKVSYVKS